MEQLVHVLGGDKTNELLADEDFLQLSLPSFK